MISNVETSHAPMISVIVPIYNVQDYLAQCLDSLAAQTYADFEVLCINDGSTDGSAEIVRQFTSADKRFVLVDKVNGGYGSACNLGLSRARGQWVSIIEPDDWVEPTMYEDMLAYASGFFCDIDIVKTSWTDVFDWDNPQRMVLKPGFLTGRMSTSTAPAPVTELPILLEGHPSIWSSLYRRAFLDQNEIRFNEYPGAGWADNPFFIEVMCRACSIVYLDRRFYNYRRELSGSKPRTASDATICIPFDRWLDMLDIIERIGKPDPVILDAHYLRGMNYAFEAIARFGWDNDLVQSKTREVFSKMDLDAVLSHPKISCGKKRFFCNVTGATYRLKGVAGRVAYLTSELIFRLSSRG